jgi:hypothetical protein
MPDPGARGEAPGTRFLDPKVLARIGNLELLARTVVEGFLSGLHRSPYLGRSIDFAEHRQYMPGDDIRRIDWRLFGRTDRFYLKEFEADSNTDLIQLLDVSRSMHFTTTAATSRRALPTSRAGSATASGCSPSTGTWSTSFRPRRSTCPCCCTRSTGPWTASARAAAESWPGRCTRPRRPIIGAASWS